MSCAAQIYANLEILRGQGQFGEFHGMPRVEEWAIDELKTWFVPPQLSAA